MEDSLLTVVSFCVGLAFGYFVLPMVLAMRALPHSSLTLFKDDKTKAPE